MPPLLVVSAVAAGVSVTAALIGAIALIRAGKLFRAVQGQSAAGLAECQSEIDALTECVDKLTRGQREMERQMATMAVVAPQRPALNLTKRSQALRMDRHGDPPEQIASVLELPLQEVELLIKVHRIVMSNV